ncbi:MAG: putative sulfate/molybdate transporter [Bacteroidales bacterium]|nr:putative sulfate/molybdate transporter [Bacteroidales bacterium]
MSMEPTPTPRIRLDRHELAGSFGDIGTDLPLLVGMIMAAGLHAPGVFVVFGVMQILTGWIYGLPMPVQPLKGMAALVIAGKIAGDVLFGAGLAIGLIMFLLAVTGSLDRLDRLVPRCVIRGIQFGLGLTLATIALKTYVPSQGTAGFIVAGAGFAALVILAGNRRVPGGLVLILIGAVYALTFRVHPTVLVEGIGFGLPTFHAPTSDNIVTGFWLLVIPQLPLSLANSVIATKQTVADLFPQRSISVKKIGMTYGVVNLLAPWFGGVPICHGSGGLAGHHAFGGRTGGSVVIYGTVYLVIGLFFGETLSQVLEVFPLPVLGIVLAYEALALMRLIADQAADRRTMTIALVVALAAYGLPQGYVVGLSIGLLLFYFPNFLKLIEVSPTPAQTVSPAVVPLVQAPASPSTPADVTKKDT